MANNPFQQPVAAPVVNNAPQKSSKSGKFPKISPMKLLFVGVFLMVGLQLVILLVLVFKPFDEENLNKKVIKEVADQVDVNPYEVPTIAVIANAESLKSGNVIQAQIYQDAQDGDFVLGYSNKMVIYRRDSKEVIYDGDSPGATLTKTQQKVSEEIRALAIGQGLLTPETTEEPQLSVVSDPQKLKERDDKFYADIQEGDVVAVFSDAGLIILYRQETGAIVNSGTYQTRIEVGK